MTTIKSYTDLSQSKKLAEILPLKSADMRFCFSHTLGGRTTGHYPMIGREPSLGTIPCWSLAALLNVLPEGTILPKATNISYVGDVKYHCDCPKLNIDKWFDNPIDACYEMILKLHELNLL